MASNLLHLIDTEEPWEVAFWAEQFEVSIPQLVDAIRAVGNSAFDVEKYFQVLEQDSPMRAQRVA